MCGPRFGVRRTLVCHPNRGAGSGSLLHGERKKIVPWRVKPFVDTAISLPLDRLAIERRKPRDKHLGRPGSRVHYDHNPVHSN